MRPRYARFTAFFVALLLVASGLGLGCGAESGGEGGGEVSLAVYTADGFSLKYPSTWAKTSEAPLTFTGQDESLAIELRQSRGATPQTLASQDITSLLMTTPGFKQTSLSASKDVKNATVLRYEWTLPQSAITGKPVPQKAERYYIDLGNGQLAILSGSGPTARFDSEQVRDIALSVKATP